MWSFGSLDCHGSSLLLLLLILMLLHHIRHDLLLFELKLSSSRAATKQSIEKAGRIVDYRSGLRGFERGTLLKVCVVCGRVRRWRFFDRNVVGSLDRLDAVC